MRINNANKEEQNMRTRPPKTSLNLHVRIDTKERLQQYAEENHTTVSQAVTDWIWQQKLRTETKETEMEEK